MHRHGEAIAAPGHGGNRPVALEMRIQDLAQRRDVVGNAALFDEGIRPHPLQDLFLGDDAARFLDEQAQGVERLGREGNELAAAVQGPRGRFQPERAEFEVVR
jgi:hypothetical protein